MGKTSILYHDWWGNLDVKRHTHKTKNKTKQNKTKQNKTKQNKTSEFLKWYKLSTCYGLNPQENELES